MSLAGGLSALGYGISDTYGRKALIDAQVAADTEREKRLMEIRAEQDAKMRTEQVARIQGKANELADTALAPNRGLIDSGIQDRASWTPEQQAAVDQSLALDRESLATDPDVRLRAAAETGDLSLKEVALMEREDKRLEAAERAAARKEELTREEWNRKDERQREREAATDRRLLATLQAAEARQERSLAAAEDRWRRSSDAKVPSGYRVRADGSGLEPIPGGPADMKLQGAFNADTAALTGSVGSFDRLAAAANELRQHPGLKGITGLRGAIPNVPGSSAADAESMLNTLKSQVAFGVLQDMRNQSKTGGALGAVSEKELLLLQNNLAALEKAQSYEQMVKSLDGILSYTGQAKDRMFQAFNLKHGDKKAGAEASSNSPTAAPAASGGWGIREIK